MSATASVNQANSQHSTGPKTDEGKQISSQNALRHGLTAQQVLLPNEDRHACHHHLKSFPDHLQPQGPVEATLVQTLADTAWRLNRVVKLETKLLRSEEALETQIKSLANLSLYTRRLTGQFEKAEKQLPELQDLRRNAKKNMESDAMASFFQAPNSTPPPPLPSPPLAPGPCPPALRDFVVESNRGGQIQFVENESLRTRELRSPRVRAARSSPVTKVFVL